MGLEPTTAWLPVKCSPNWALPKVILWWYHRGRQVFTLLYSPASIFLWISWSRSNPFLGLDVRHLKRMSCSASHPNFSYIFMRSFFSAPTICCLLWDPTRFTSLRPLCKISRSVSNILSPEGLLFSAISISLAITVRQFVLHCSLFKTPWCWKISSNSSEKTQVCGTVSMSKWAKNASIDATINVKLREIISATASTSDNLIWTSPWKRSQSPKSSGPTRLDKSRSTGISSIQGSHQVAQWTTIDGKQFAKWLLDLLTLHDWCALSLLFRRRDSWWVVHQPAQGHAVWPDLQLLPVLFG